jgi:hypothetical protein
LLLIYGIWRLLEKLGESRSKRKALILDSRLGMFLLSSLLSVRVKSKSGMIYSVDDLMSSVEIWLKSPKRLGKRCLLESFAGVSGRTTPETRSQLCLRR